MLFVGAPSLLAAALPPIEAMPTLDAATLVPAELLNRNGYTVDARVPVVGYMGQFTLRGPAGTFAADGTEMLAIRFAELSAIAELGRLSESGVFADALAASALKTGAAIGQAVMNPVETISGIPGGVDRADCADCADCARSAHCIGGEPGHRPGLDHRVRQQRPGDLLQVGVADRVVDLEIEVLALAH